MFNTGISSAEIVLPQGDDVDIVHDSYIAITTVVAVTDEQREVLVRVGEKLCREQGADAVALAGTDMFLAFDGVACGYDGDRLRPRPHRGHRRPRAPLEADSGPLRS